MVAELTELLAFNSWSKGTALQVIHRVELESIHTTGLYCPSAQYNGA